MERTSLVRPAVCLLVWLVVLGCLQALPVATGVADAAATASGTTGVSTDAPANGTTGVSDAGPAVVAAYPNPVAGGDAGEFAVVRLPADGSDRPDRSLVLTDGDWRVSLGTVAGDVPTSDRTGSRRIAVASDARARGLTDLPVVVRSDLSLANGGERLRIVAGSDGASLQSRSNSDATGGETLAAVRYADAAEGEVARWHGSAVEWRPLGATDRPVVTGGPDTVRAFTLPDSPGIPIDVLQSADRRILLAGYTLTSARVADALAGAARRNVSVRVLLEGSPIGGRTRRGARTLDRLASAGVDVRVIDGPHDRYAYHHPKYAVVDDRAVVLTENWKPAGTGGNSSRGWGVVTRQPRIVDGLAATFAADANWRDARNWIGFRQGKTFERGERAIGSYPRRIAPDRVAVNRTELLVAPDNAGGRIVRALEDADRSVDVLQASIGDWDGRFSVALRRAAKRGVGVRLLLSSAWYAREENRQVVERFRAWAERTGAPLSARLATPGDRFGKVHAKGAVIDDRRVVLGSLNWNDHSARENREVVLLLHGREAAAFYGDAFRRDWRGPRSRLPLGLLAGVAGVLVVAGLVLARIRFASSGARGTREFDDRGVDDRNGQRPDGTGARRPQRVASGRGDARAAEPRSARNRHAAGESEVRERAADRNHDRDGVRENASF